MKKKIYLIQPTYRKMDGKLVKGHTTFNHSLNIPILSATIPKDWEKEICLEYFEDVNYETDASVVCISCMGYDILHALEIVSEFKKRSKLILFGAHMDELSEKVFKRVCDSVFYGNPNPIAMAKILDDAIKGQIQPEYKCGISLNFNFDYSVLDGKQTKYIHMLSSAGCKNNCEYCCVAGRYEGNYRVRNIDIVISDMKEVRKRTRFAGFVDSNFYNNRKYTVRLCKRIIKEKIGMLWGAQSTIDIGDDSEILYYLKQSGCKFLFIGLETLNQKNLQKMDKDYEIIKYENQIKKIRKAGIQIVGYFMLGFDNDTSDTFNSIFNYIKRTKIALPLLNILMPVPGTNFYKKLKSEGRILINNEDEFITNSPLYSVPCNHCFFIPKNMSTRDLETKYLSLYKKVQTYREIFRRSIVSNPIVAYNIFFMNLGIRKDYKTMAKNAALQNKQ